MRHDRVVLAYHGCDAAVAERLLAGEPFHRSENDYDWLGAGVYFWEYGADRALQFARDQQRRGKVAEPAVVGALVQLGNCFDLMDTVYTEDLAAAFQGVSRQGRSSGVSAAAAAAGWRALTALGTRRPAECEAVNVWATSGQTSPC